MVSDGFTIFYLLVRESVQAVLDQTHLGLQSFPSHYAERFFELFLSAVAAHMPGNSLKRIRKTSPQDGVGNFVDSVKGYCLNICLPALKLNAVIS